MNAFGLTERDLPRAVIDDTAIGKKFVENSRIVSTESFEKFWKTFLSLP
jgi:hypothetical protein